MPDDDDLLDGMCDLDFDNGPPVSDEDAPYVALFCDVLDCDEHVRDRQALAHEAQAWHTLLPHHARAMLDAT